MNVFDYQGITWGAGLFWQTCPGEPSKEKPSYVGLGKESLNLAKQLDLPLFVWRDGAIPHIGFSEKPQEKKVASIAACLGKGFSTLYPDRSDNMLAAFEVSQNNWYMFAQRDGVILPDGDFLGTEEEIQQKVSESLSITDWDLIVAPEFWGISEAIPISLHDALPTTKSGAIDTSGAILRPVKKSIKKELSLAVAVIMLGVGGYVGYMYYENLQQQQRFEQARLNAISSQQSQIEVLPSPETWRKVALHGPFLKSCEDMLSSVDLFPGDWVLQPVTCSLSNNQASLSMSWTSGEFGWISFIKETHPNYALSSDGKLLNYSTSASLGTINNSHENNLPRSIEVVQHLNSFAQMHLLSIQIRENQVQAPPSTEFVQYQPPHWQEYLWEIQSPHKLDHSFFDRMYTEGFRVLSTTLSLNQDGQTSYMYRGVQYAQ